MGIAWKAEKMVILCRGLEGKKNKVSKLATLWNRQNKLSSPAAWVPTLQGVLRSPSLIRTVRKKKEEIVKGLR